VWISFMETALRGVPVTEIAAPEGVVNVGGEWFFDEFTRGSGVSNLGLEDRAAKGSAPGASASQELPAADERKRILDLFKN
jgi:penicillin-binding protein 1A